MKMKRPKVNDYPDTTVEASIALPFCIISIYVILPPLESPSNAADSVLTARLRILVACSLFLFTQFSPSKLAQFTSSLNPFQRSLLTLLCLFTPLYRVKYKTKKQRKVHISFNQTQTNRLTVVNGAAFQTTQARRLVPSRSFYLNIKKMREVLNQKVQRTRLVLYHQSPLISLLQQMGRMWFMLEENDSWCDIEDIICETLAIPRTIL